MFKNIQSAFNNAIKTVTNVVKSVTNAFSGSKSRTSSSSLTQARVDQAYKKAGVRPLQNYSQTAKQTTPVSRAIASLKEAPRSGMPSVITPSVNRGIGVSAPKISKDIGFYVRQAQMERLQNQLNVMLEPAKMILAYVDRNRAKSTFNSPSGINNGTRLSKTYTDSVDSFEPAKDMADWSTLSPQEAAVRIYSELTNPKNAQQQQDYQSIISALKNIQYETPGRTPSSKIGRNSIADTLANLSSMGQSTPMDTSTTEESIPSSYVAPPPPLPKVKSPVVQADLPRVVTRALRPKTRGGGYA